MDNGITKEKLMTTKEVAEQLKCATNTLRENAKKCLPDKVFQNGKKTYWTESEITILIEFMKNNQYTTVQVKDSNLSTSSTGLTPAFKVQQAMLMMKEAMEEEIANLKAQNIEVVEENGQLKLKNAQLEHALEYDKVAGWKPWNLLKKEIKYKGNFQTLVKAIPLIEEEDFAKKVMADDCYPTTLISLTGEEKIIDYKETVLDEE